MIGTPTTSQLTAVGIWVAAVGFFGVLVRQIVPWKKITGDAEARLRDTLIARVDKLERRLDRQQARHDAEKRQLVHRLRNMTANFDSMLNMLEMSPDRGPEIVAIIKKQRADQMMAEAKESAIISAAEIAADALDEEGERG